MKRKKIVDPLVDLPSIETIRDELSKSRQHTKRLEILLEFAERLQLPQAANDLVPASATGKSPTSTR